MQPTFWQTGDAARELRCSPQYVRRLSDGNVLPVRALTARGDRLFDPDDVKRVAKERKDRRLSGHPQPGGTPGPGQTNG